MGTICNFATPWSKRNARCARLEHGNEYVQQRDSKGQRSSVLGPVLEAAGCGGWTSCGFVAFYRPRGVGATGQDVDVGDFWRHGVGDLCDRAKGDAVDDGGDVRCDGG